MSPKHDHRGAQSEGQERLSRFAGRKGEQRAGEGARWKTTGPALENGAGQSQEAGAPALPKKS